MSAQDERDLGVAPEAIRPDSCALDLKKYFYVIAVAATLILGGTYWYTKFYAKGMGSMPMAGADAKSGATKAVANWFPNLTGGGAAMAQPQPQPGVGIAQAQPQPQPQPGVVAGRSPAEFVLARANFPSVVAAVHDSVVHISATRGGPAPAAIDPQANAPGVRFPNPFAGRTYESIGAGLIVQGDGYVVTNYHVVRGANAVSVAVAHGPMAGRYPAQVLKLDESVDLALLKIQPRGPLVAGTLGNSDDVRVADGVIAIGSPFGLEQTVSHGIVSAVRKSMVIEGVTHTNLIQTDAAINQGNSGGPLIAKNGAVIGINTAIYTPTGAFAGIGFAVPSNSVRMFLQGVGNVASSNAAAFAQPVAMTSPGMGQGVGGPGVGAAGPTIIAGTPAPHADGREKMDCLMCHKVVAAASAPAPAPVAMQFQFAQPNTSLAMNVAAPRGAAPPINANARAPHRDGRENMNCKACHAIIGAGAAATAPVVFALPAGAPPSGLAMNVAAVAPGKDPVLTGTGTAAMGAGFVLIDKALAARLNHMERQGVFVGRVAPNTAAAASGLNPGDIVLKIDGRRIRDPGQAVSTLAARKSGEVARLGVLRNGKDTQIYLVVADMTVAAGAGPAAGMAAAGGPNPAANNAAPKPPPNEFSWMGLEIEAFSMVRPVGAPGTKSIQGAKINEVTRGSAAEKAGVKVGDLLVEINRLPVANAGQMDRAVRAANGQPGKLLTLMRGTETFFAVLP